MIPKLCRYLNALSAWDEHSRALTSTRVRVLANRSPVYGWFTEGFDTLDLKESKALLNELAS
jgi:hypothetical protein